VDSSRLPDPNEQAPDSDSSYVPPENDVEATLVTIWSELLGLEMVGRHDHFFEIGGDSIVSIQVISRAREAGLQIEPKHVIDHPTIAELAQVVLSVAGTDAEQGPVTGAVQLAPIQRWFSELDLAAPHHWNHAALWEANDHIDPGLVQEAFDHCLAHHDALRGQFRRTEDQWRLSFVSMDQLPQVQSTVDLAALSASEQNQYRERHIGEVQAEFELDGGALVRVVRFKQGANQRDLWLLAVHHLLIDQFSWSVLLSDWHTAYHQLQDGRRVSLPAKTTSYQQWSESLLELAASSTLETELPFWLGTRATDGHPLSELRGDNPFPTEGTAQTWTLTFDERQTELLLTDANRAYQTKIDDLLLTALAMSLCRSTGDTALSIGLEGHGRDSLTDGVDLSRTVGWCTAFYPVTLRMEVIDDLSASIKSVKEQLRAVPNGGIGYGVLRYLQPDTTVRQALAAIPAPQILFNYLGQIRSDPIVSWLRPVPGAEPSSRDPANLKTHLLEINAAVRDGHLQVSWTSGHHAHQTGALQNLAGEFKTTLLALVDHCVTAETGGFTPSDFPEAELSQEELDRLLDGL